MALEKQLKPGQDEKRVKLTGDRFGGDLGGEGRV